MIHLKKYILTLVALLAVTTQAWAADTYKIVSTTTMNNNPSSPIVKEAAASLPCTKKFIDWVDTGYNRDYSNYIVENINVTGDNIVKGTDKNWDTEITVNGAGIGKVTFEISSWHFYVTVTVTKNASSTPVPVAWNADTKTGTIASMPSGNVTVNVDYFPQAEFTTGCEPAAIADVQANTDNDIVTPGTVKTIGTSSVKMGTVMYHASQTALTDAELLALGTDDWSSDVPKATNLGTGDAYVYYYIQGAEPANVADRSDDNTCSDSDIKATNVVYVTLIAPPTYDVVINTAGLSAEEAGKWSASPNTGVKKGDDVTVTYSGSRKVIGVKAQKTGPLYMKWDDSQKSLVPTEIPATAIKVEHAYDCVAWPAGTYLVEGDVDINGFFELKGDVDLIIKDGAKLTAKFIYGEDIYSLSVYGQTNMSGELNLACFGDDAINSMTALNIHSCKVNASSSADGYGGLNNIDVINVYGGSVDAEFTGDPYGYGMSIKTLNIYGGEVKAIGRGNSSLLSYGITADDSAPVKVYGGKLWAECNGSKSGIRSSRVTLTKEGGFSGKIETSDDGTSWTEYTETDTPEAKYVRVGY